MTSRERTIRALSHEPVDRLPRDLWTVPYMQMYRNDELERFYKKFPLDIGGSPEFRYGASRYTKGGQFRKGVYTDEFGSVWEALEEGITGEIKNPIIKTPRDLDNYRLPWEILDDAVGDGASGAYKASDKYILQGTYVRPFERMQFLLGSEEFFIQIATEGELFLRLREMLHEFNLKNMKLAASQAADGVSFMDDWGTQIALLISPAAWRKYFKPMYKEYCDIIHSKGKHAFFHSDGHTREIIGDLVEIGVDALNTQVFCMNMEELGDKYAGKIAFWGELDRQNILPFGTPDEVRQSVRRYINALTKGKKTGVIAELSWETVTPYENVDAAYEEFLNI